MSQPLTRKSNGLSGGLAQFVVRLSPYMLTVQYYYSACVGIHTPDVRMLCDPWFTDGIYDGSWYHYPAISGDPIAMLGPYDVIYVSHIHPDHYDPAFLRRYLSVYPHATVLIAQSGHPYLSRKMTADGISHQCRESGHFGETTYAIVPNFPESPFAVDTALVVCHQGQSVVNMNDNFYYEPHVQAIRAFVGGDATLALLGYTGAGPYPQTYFDLSDEAALLAKAEQKKADFFQRYLRMKAALGAKRAMPFAGQYILGGHLHTLNPYRGVADAVDVVSVDPDAIILADAGQGSVDTETLCPNNPRTAPYDIPEMLAYALSLADKPMRSETYFAGLAVEAIPFARLLSKAYTHAQTKSLYPLDYFICIRMIDNWFVMNINSEKANCYFADAVIDITPRSEITVDLRYLFGLLTGVFHWNNAEIGSQYLTRRIPDAFDSRIQAFFNFLHV